MQWKEFIWVFSSPFTAWRAIYGTFLILGYNSIGDQAYHTQTASCAISDTKQSVVNA